MEVSDLAKLTRSLRVPNVIPPRKRKRKLKPIRHDSIKSSHSEVDLAAIKQQKSLEIKSKIKMFGRRISQRKLPVFKGTEKLKGVTDMLFMNAYDLNKTTILPEQQKDEEVIQSLRREVKNASTIISVHSIQRSHDNATLFRSYLQRGFALCHLGLHHKAVQDFTSCLSLNSKSVDALFNRAAAKYGLEYYESAIEDLTIAIELAPERLTFRQNRALLLRQVGRYKEAMVDCDYLKEHKFDIGASLSIHQDTMPYQIATLDSGTGSICSSQSPSRPSTPLQNYQQNQLSVSIAPINRPSSSQSTRTSLSMTSKVLQSPCRRRLQARIAEENKADIFTRLEFLMEIPPEERTDHDNIDVFKCIKHLSFFLDMPEEIALSLCKNFSMKSYETESCVFKQGDDGDALYVIIKGVVTVKKNYNGNIGNIVVRRLHVGDQFGELALQHNKPRSASIFVDQDLTCLVLPREHYDLARPKLEEWLVSGNVAMLKSTHLFETWPPERLVELGRAAEIRRFDAGHAIVEEGTMGEYLHVIRKGICRAIVKTGEMGHEKTVQAHFSHKRQVKRVSMQYAVKQAVVNAHKVQEARSHFRPAPITVLTSPRPAPTSKVSYSILCYHTQGVLPKHAQLSCFSVIMHMIKM
eukprot:TRINITY_DN48215_c0_g1_i2.p1 TRINITY_DN48215_c0_g1~~TRINITY_DN48215_c0_g1_i2.p1  ORF type:complete len:637 (+),score=113.56 TRINITY_DN48215_c0_g1_i2:195-2105(+)